MIRNWPTQTWIGANMINGSKHIYVWRQYVNGYVNDPPQKIVPALWDWFVDAFKLGQYIGRGQKAQNLWQRPLRCSKMTRGVANLIALKTSIPFPTAKDDLKNWPSKSDISDKVILIEISRLNKFFSLLRNISFIKNTIQ